MPFKSDKQRRAMHAAAEGHSNIGIPKAAAKSFIKHSKGKTSMKRSKKHNRGN